MDFDLHLGQVVTLKTANGLEIMGLLELSESNSESVLLSKPRVVVVSDENIAVMPYMFTADGSIPFQKSLILSMALSDQASATDYLRAAGHVEDTK
jgi:hypothetical protein